jgi:HK97 family phage portal protein
MALRDLFRRKPASASSATPSSPAAVMAATDYALLSTREQIDQFLRGRATTASGAVVTADTALQVAAVFRCVDIIAGAIASLPLYVMRQSADGRTRPRDLDSDLSRILGRKPNPWQTASEFRRMMMAHVLLRGNAYAYIVRSGRRILDLVPLHPDRMSVEDDWSGGELALVYRYTPLNGQTRTLRTTDVLHLRDLSTDGKEGLSRIALMREAVGLSMRTQEFGARLFKDGIGVGGALKHPDRLSPEAHARLVASMEQRYAGAENAHKWMILEEGLTAERLGLTAEDMQFLDTRKFQRSDIAMFFGVPPHLIGDTEKSTSWGSGIYEQTQGFLQFTLQPWITAWEQRLELSLVDVADIGTLYLAFDTAAMLRPSVKDRGDYYAKALGSGGSPAWMTQNEVRAELEMNPLDGGDDLPRPQGSSGVVP